MQLQAELQGLTIGGDAVGSNGMYQADGPGNDAWQRSLKLNAQMNAQQRRN